jgi:site-specific DNA recombinase
LDQLRADLKTETFDAVYFLAADRIARDAAYQSIIVGELIKHGKQIIINGEDYKNIPESKVTLTILGAVAEFERAKIIERMMRGKVHKLRNGEMFGGLAPFGYKYVKKTATKAGTIAVQEPEASIVRTMFEMSANGSSLVAISRWLQQNDIKTKLGKSMWSVIQVKCILKNRTYTRTREYRPMNLSDAVVPKHKRGPSAKSVR